MGEKRYSPAQLAQMSGVSVRTLHHYDQIGLLVPERRANGYRSYGPAEVERLQQILIFKSSGMELADIGRILDSPAFDARTALRTHLAELTRVNQFLDFVDVCVESVADSDIQDFTGFVGNLLHLKRFGKNPRGGFFA